MSRVFNPTEYMEYSGTNLLRHGLEPLEIGLWYKTAVTENGSPTNFLVLFNSPSGFWAITFDGFANTIYNRTTNLGGTSSSGGSTTLTEGAVWQLAVGRFVTSSSRFMLNGSTQSAENTTAVSHAGETVSTIRVGGNGSPGPTGDVRLAHVFAINRQSTADERTRLLTQLPTAVFARSDLYFYWSLDNTLVDTINGWTLADVVGSSTFDSDMPALTRKVIVART